MDNLILLILCCLVWGWAGVRYGKAYILKKLYDNGDITSETFNRYKS